MYIPEEKVSEILGISDIVAVISESVILKQSGRNYLGLCPFHSEKTPSFSVSPEKQIFHCFGCGAGGNVFSFLMKYHGISFPEAARMLADRYHITVQTASLDPAVKKEFALRENLFRLNKEVMAYFQHTLADTDKGRKAREYLRERGISDEMIQQFHIGFAQDAWDALVRKFRSMKVGTNLALKSGLVLPRKKTSGYYDRFRNRIIFPIFDINMQVAGFGGRVMDEALPKYLNSPETPVYNKSRILYGLHVSKPDVRQAGSVYVVEGYFDFISLYQHRIKNVAATLGTALTKEHVRLLKGYAPKAVLVFDSDQAGINAAKRSISIFTGEGMDVKVLVLPEEKDPDAFIREYGKAAFEEAASEAVSVIEFLTDTAIDKFGLSIEGRVAVVDEMTHYLSQIQDSALRSLHIQALAEKINIDEKAVLQKVKDVYLKKKQPDDAVKEKTDFAGAPESDRREKQMLSMLLQSPDIREEVKKTGVLAYFFSERLKQIGRKAVAMDEDGENILSKMMLAAENDEERELIASLAMEQTAAPDKIFEKSLSLIKRIIKVKNRRDDNLLKKIKDADKEFDSELVALLNKKQKEIRRLH